MAGISSSSDFNPVQNPSQDSRPLPDAQSSAPVFSVLLSAGSPHPPSASDVGPPAAVEIKVPDQLSLSYRVDQKAQQVYVQFVDSKTGAVINQLPPPQVLAFEDQVAQYLDSSRQAESAQAVPGNAGGPTSAKEG